MIRDFKDGGLLDAVALVDPTIVPVLYRLLPFAYRPMTSTRMAVVAMRLPGYNHQVSRVPIGTFDPPSHAGTHRAKRWPWWWVQPCRRSGEATPPAAPCPLAGEVPFDREFVVVKAVMLRRLGAVKPCPPQRRP